MLNNTLWKSYDSQIIFSPLISTETFQGKSSLKLPADNKEHSLSFELQTTWSALVYQTTVNSFEPK